MSRTLEITVLSAENLRINRKSVKKNTFVKIRSDSFNYFTTKMNTDGGSYPSWNEKLVVQLPMHSRYVPIEVHCKTSMGNRLLGAAKIPVTDFVGGLVPENYLHFLSYRLRDAHGERNGIINLSVRVKVPEYGCSASASQPILGVAMNERKNCGGVVTGVPVWYTCSA